MLVALALVIAAASLGVSLALAERLRVLNERLAALERPPPRQEEKALAGPSPLAGLRVAIDVRQDHPHPVFEWLLREALLREEAVIDEAGEVRIEGEVMGNGYADVYFRAELTALFSEERLLVLSERPAHGDRPENLAREFVARLRLEIEKRERHGALRELWMRNG